MTLRGNYAHPDVRGSVNDALLAAIDECQVKAPYEDDLDQADNPATPHVEQWGAGDVIESVERPTPN
jgi:hypothetical protein